MNSSQLLQSLPGLAAVLTAIAAVIGAIASMRAGRAQLQAKNEQIALLERLMPARMSEHINGLKNSYEVLLERTKEDLSETERALIEARQSKALTDAQLAELRQEREILQSTVGEFESRLAIATQASKAVEELRVLRSGLQASMLASRELEASVVKALEKAGFGVTRATSSMGVDYLGVRDGQTTVVEIKGGSRPVSVETISQVASARERLQAAGAMVISSGVFTTAAHIEAARMDVQLVDAGQLDGMLRNTDKS